MLRALFAALLFGTAGCSAVRLPEACEREVSECLGDCREDPGRDERFRGTVVGDDVRSACERRCHQLCRD